MKALLIAALGVSTVAILVWLIWPTAYSYSTYYGFPLRINRFTRRMEVLTPSAVPNPHVEWRMLNVQPRTKPVPFPPCLTGNNATLLHTIITLDESINGVIAKTVGINYQPILSPVLSDSKQPLPDNYFKNLLGNSKETAGSISLEWILGNKSDKSVVSWDLDDSGKYKGTSSLLPSGTTRYVIMGLEPWQYHSIFIQECNETGCSGVACPSEDIALPESARRKLEEMQAQQFEKSSGQKHE